MSVTLTSRQHIHRLLEIRNRYDREASQEKRKLLRRMRGIKLRAAAETRYLHTALCFIRAFPDSKTHYREAHSLLLEFDKSVCKLPATVQSELWDTGIAGTPVHYRFSYEVASWMARKIPAAISIDWEEMGDTSRLDELLEHLLLPPEQDYFDSGYVRSKEWIELASSNAGGTAFEWLLAQLQHDDYISIWSQSYNSAELALAWDLSDSAWSVSKNTISVQSLKFRKAGMRRRIPAPKKEVMRPLENSRKLSPQKAAKLIDTAMASLAVRHRETYHFNYANPKEVYLADVGEGISVAVLGLQHKYRFPLECTMGYLILSNGTPIGYGGSSILFRQVNTGVNIFAEYRGSEASFLWLQVMRVYHHLAGCTRFIANPYQFGSDNTEALKSGAFWFYYRLGYRPVLSAIRKLAKCESARMRNDRSYRSDLRTLTRLACCDMHFVLPGVRASELFEERWIETSSMLATQEIGAAGGLTRADSSRRVADKVARELGLRSVENWTKEEGEAFRRLAPIVAAASPAAWPVDAKRSMRKLLRAKGGAEEAKYARLLSEQSYFLAQLRASCRRAEFH